MAEWQTVDVNNLLHRCSVLEVVRVEYIYGLPCVNALFDATELIAVMR